MRGLAAAIRQRSGVCVKTARFVFVVALLLCSEFCSASASAQSAEPEKPEKEVAIVELGAAASRSLTGGGSSFGLTSRSR